MSDLKNDVMDRALHSDGQRELNDMHFNDNKEGEENFESNVEE
jgi:hypothetical protein